MITSPTVRPPSPLNSNSPSFADRGGQRVQVMSPTSTNPTLPTSRSSTLPDTLFSKSTTRVSYRTMRNVTRCVFLLSSSLRGLSTPLSTHTQHPHNTNHTTPPLPTQVRIGSKDYYALGSIWIFDIAHLPYGCSVWPGVWTSAFKWPDQGEIDIVEGINKMTSNQMALHTLAGCNAATGTNAVNQPAITNCNDTQGSECTVVSVLGNVGGETTEHPWRIVRFE